MYKAAGTACDDGNSCTTNDQCNDTGSCLGTPSCAPGTPGPIQGPTNSTTGSYTLTWGASTGVVSRYELYENGAALFANLPAWPPSLDISGRTDASYTYKIRACGTGGCSAFTADFTVTVLFLPGTPNSLTVPGQPGPDYTVSWAPGTGRTDQYELNESTDGITWPTTYTVTTTSKSFVGVPYGVRWYRVRASNPSGYSAYTSAQRTEVVSRIAALIPDKAPAAPSQPVPPYPPQSWVGTIPGTASVEGGAASYHVPIEIPPGRLGMQPQLALNYSSRSGNGIAGVGWSLSGTRSIYRCPRTLAQDLGNGSVQHTPPTPLATADRLCFDGQRLVGDSLYGQSGSEYRTEVDQYDRIKLLNGDTSSWSSYFQVEHKSGRISQFEPVISSSGRVPDTWYLVREYDPQGNCVVYNYATGSLPRSDPERLLNSVTYTGSGIAGQRTCALDATARLVQLTYTYDRADKRTTYRYGVASPMTARLSSISTNVGSQIVRTYQLSYKPSSATGRSLLQSVIVCAGPNCGYALPPTSFAYQEDPPTFDFSQIQFNGQTLDANWQASAAADYDGDGTREHVYDYFDPVTHARTRYLDQTSCYQTNTLVPPLTADRGLNFEDPSVVTRLDGSEDIDNDGRADIIGSTTINGQRALAFSTTTACNTWSAARPTRLPLDYGNGIDLIASPIDYDGDGLLDLRYLKRQLIPNSNPPQYTFVEEGIFRRLTKDTSDWVTNVNIVSYPPTPPNMSRRMERDLNGDGFVDTVFETSFGSAQEPQVAFYLGPTSGGYATYLLAALGGPAGAFSDHPQRKWIDVNGDGLPDIYEPGTVWLNQGGANRATTFRAVPVTMPSDPFDPANNLLRSHNAFAMDVDSDGRDELMVPNFRTIPYCVTATDREGFKTRYCGDEIDTAPVADSVDHSVFSWNAYRFVELDNGSFALTLASTNSTNFQAPVNSASGVTTLDWNGDGMTDGLSKLLNGPAEDPDQSKYSGLTPQQLGPRVSRNQARAPDLLVSVTNGLNATASWVHQPLSLPPSLQAAVSGCDMPEPFYVAHNNDTTSKSSDYVYFTSNMWAVSRFDASNGLGTATNKTCYRYQDAMLNAEGRGFQGFKVIVAEEQMPPAAGENAGFAGCAASGGTCSINNTRTTTEFHQEFPLTSRPRMITVQLTKPGGTNLSETSYWWHKIQGTFSAWVVYSSASLEKKYDLGTGPPLAVQTTTVSEVDSVSGEVARSCVIGNGETPANTSPTGLTLVAKDVIKSDTRTLTNDTSAWWLGRIDSRQLVADFFETPYSLPACQVSGTGTWNCAPSPPVCPTFTPSANAKSRTTNYTWNTTPGASEYRKVRIESLVAASATQATTTYVYTTYGNLLSKQVAARDASTDSSFPPTNRALVTLPAMTYSYSADGYFRETETALPRDTGAAHVTTTIFDPTIGLPVYHRDINNGPVTVTRYDAFRRPLTVTTDGTQPIEQRLTPACPGNAACAVGNFVMKRQSFQSGSPIKTEYVDRVGRVIATGTEGFDTFEIISRVDYNARGIKVAEFVPWSTGLRAGLWNGGATSAYGTTYSGIDALGRVAHRESIRNATIFEPGNGDPVFKTDYVYSVVSMGPRTDITVYKPASQGGSLTMSRTYDRRGKLVETTQHLTVPSAHDVRTNYFYDPAASVIQILDTTLNRITAAYDNLGRKTQMVDPDRGTWNYTWDGLGRLRSQTDARGVVLSYQYDALGRLERRFEQTTSTAAVQLDAFWQYDLNGQIGVLAALSNPLDTYRRDYVYDSLLRPLRVTTHIPADSGWVSRDLVMEYAYDRNHGWMKGTIYPGSEMVALSYSDAGYALSEQPVAVDGTLGSPYRTVNTMTVRGQVSRQTLGNGIVDTMAYDDSTGMELSTRAGELREPPPTGCAPPSQLPARNTVYTYDHYLNLSKQSKSFLLRDTANLIKYSGCAPQQATAVESYPYDELQRLSSSNRSWVGMTPAGTPTPSDTYAYDDLGNITSKSDYGTSYVYGTAARNTGNAGPHAVLTLTKVGGTMVSYTYDQNGNMLTGDGRTLTFDNLDRAVSIVMGTVTTIFRYAPDGARYLQRTTGIAPPSPSSRTIYYVDKEYERVDWPSLSEDRSYIGPSTIVHWSGATRDVVYQHVDRLGSPDTMTNAGGFEIPAEAHGFDAYGKPRGRDWQPSGDKLHAGGEYGAVTDRGFTKHEHLDDTFLIHMNGRTYDYRLGRFLSVDPIISNPADSQSINPYSYIGNNPLSGKDPTGYAPCGNTGQSDTCNSDSNPNTTAAENAGSKTSNKETPYTLVQARQDRSIAGRAGDNTLVNGADQDSAAGHATLAPTKSNGYTPQGSDNTSTTTTDAGGPKDTALASNNAKISTSSFLPGDGTRAAVQIEQDIRDLVEGKISQDEYWDRAQARATGAAIGVAVVGGALGAAAARGPIVQAAAAGTAATARALNSGDLGIEGKVEALKGTVTKAGGLVTVRIEMIKGTISNPFGVVNNITNMAREMGATSVRIEGTIANPRLMDVLVKRYGMTSNGATDAITIPLKK